MYIILSYNGMHKFPLVLTKIFVYQERIAATVNQVHYFF